MKIVFPLLLAVMLTACTQHDAVHQENINTVADSLNRAPIYKIGLADIMSSVLVHHHNLWFAGVNGDWKLAEKELNEIKGRLNTAQTIEDKKKETAAIPLLYPKLDSILYAIQRKNTKGFKSSFQSLTNGCNSCHQAVNSKIFVPNP